MGNIHQVNIACSTLQCKKKCMMKCNDKLCDFEEILKSQSLTREQSHDPHWTVCVCCAQVKDWAFSRSCLEISVPKLATHTLISQTVTGWQCHSDILKTENVSLQQLSGTAPVFSTLRVNMELPPTPSCITFVTFDHKNELIISKLKGFLSIQHQLNLKTTAELTLV